MTPRVGGSNFVYHPFFCEHGGALRRVSVFLRRNLRFPQKTFSRLSLSLVRQCRPRASCACGVVAFASLRHVASLRVARHVLRSFSEGGEVAGLSRRNEMETDSSPVCHLLFCEHGGALRTLVQWFSGKIFSAPPFMETADPFPLIRHIPKKIYRIGQIVHSQNVTSDVKYPRDGMKCPILYDT